MSIALCGAHGVGKTTLGLGLYQHYRTEYMTFLAAGIARDIIARGYPLGISATMDSYVEYIIEQISALSRACEYELYISDRTLLDPYAYALVNQRNGQFLINSRELELLQRVWELKRKEYDLYLYLQNRFWQKRILRRWTRRLPTKRKRPRWWPDWSRRQFRRTPPPPSPRRST